MKTPTLRQLISLVTLIENHSELRSEWRALWESSQAGFQRATHNGRASPQPAAGRGRSLHRALDPAALLFKSAVEEPRIYFK